MYGRAQKPKRARVGGRMKTKGHEQLPKVWKDRRYDMRYKTNPGTIRCIDVLFCCLCFEFPNKVHEERLVWIGKS